LLPSCNKHRQTNMSCFVFNAAIYWW
jgi:hypothetical protein